MDNIEKLVVIGDRVLVRPSENRVSKSGLILPESCIERNEIREGYILKCGPGYPLPSNDDAEEWNGRRDEVRYLPLQVRPGDLAIYMQKNAVEIKYNGEKYYIIPQSAILMVERDDDFNL